MIKKRLVMFMSCILLIFSVSFLFSIALKGSAESPDLFEMSGSVLMKYNGSSEHVTVPASVKAIGKGAFAGNSNLQKVTIPSSVELIDYEAFADCTSLLEVDIPDSVLSIRSSAFAGCEALTDVSIGTGLQELGSGVFAGCKALSDINISPNSDTFTCVDGVLYDA
ncbi:MAG: leucine-rich repeat domain-containing protein, partial [Lachnospiraceae bacterium]|nr:leucine-rich repeat domain-containing protein [Lachnospiraceae bacterium]